MKGIIIYKSKYGSTKKYAEWLKDATGYDCVATKDADTGKLSSYDTIIFMGGVYAKGIACTSFMKKVISRIKDKKIAVFICAASPTGSMPRKAGRSSRRRPTRRTWACSATRTS